MLSCTQFSQHLIWGHSIDSCDRKGISELVVMNVAAIAPFEFFIAGISMDVELAGFVNFLLFLSLFGFDHIDR